MYLCHLKVDAVLPRLSMPASFLPLCFAFELEPEKPSGNLRLYIDINTSLLFYRAKYIHLKISFIHTLAMPSKEK